MIETNFLIIKVGDARFYLKPLFTTKIIFVFKVKERNFVIEVFVALEEVNLK